MTSLQQSTAVAKVALKKARLAAHPDRGGNAGQFQEVNNAAELVGIS